MGRKRLPKGADYYFIRVKTMKVVQTADCYFESDDLRWDGGNYFLDGRNAKKCLEVIQEKYADQLADLAEREEDAQYLGVRALANIARRATAKQRKEDDATLVSDLVIAYGEYRERVRAVEADRKAVMDAINKIIVKYSSKEK